MHIGNDSKGITLIETLIAVLILGFVFVAISLGYQQSFLISADSREKAVAVNLARETIELLKYKDDNNFSRGSNEWTKGDNAKQTIAGIIYTINTNIMNDQNSSQANIFNDSFLIPIRVTVTWTSKGRNHSVFLESCFVSSYVKSS